MAAAAGIGRVKRKTSACRVSWRVVDLVRRRSLFGDGSSGGNRQARAKAGRGIGSSSHIGTTGQRRPTRNIQAPLAAQKARPGAARTVRSMPEVADAGEDHGDAQ